MIVLPVDSLGDLLNNSTDLRDETHIKHTISLVEDKVLHVLEVGWAILDQINQSSWGSNNNVGCKQTKQIKNEHKCTEMKQEARKRNLSW